MPIVLAWYVHASNVGQGQWTYVAFVFYGNLVINWGRRIPRQIVDTAQKRKSVARLVRDPLTSGTGWKRNNGKEPSQPYRDQTWRVCDLICWMLRFPLSTIFGNQGSACLLFLFFSPSISLSGASMTVRRSSVQTDTHPSRHIVPMIDEPPSSIRIQGTISFSSLGIIAVEQIHNSRNDQTFGASSFRVFFSFGAPQRSKNKSNTRPCFRKRQ